VIQRTYRKLNVPENAKCVSEGVLFDVYQWEQTLYDGSAKTFERLIGRDIGKIVPVLTDGRIIITKDEQPARSILTKLPGGYVDDGETPEQCAVRELLEETGYVPETMQQFMDIAPWNKVDYHRTYFVAKGCVQKQAPLVQAGEKIETTLVTLDEFLTLLADGTIEDTQLQLMALQAFHDPKKMVEFRTVFGA
jgi:ADP-ribose pyrophosphatase